VRRGEVVSSADVALLHALAQERSVVRASARVGISRDRAVYRLGRLARAFGGPVVAGRRGGSGHGGSVLTPLGDRIVRGGFDTVELLDGRAASAVSVPNLLRGVYHRSPAPEVRVGRSLRLRVAFDAEDGVRTSVLLDPEAVVVARRRFPSSARNVLPAVVLGTLRAAGALEVTLLVRCGGRRLRVAVTDETVRQLGLRRGTPVWLYAKATGLRRVAGTPASPGRPRS